MLRPIRLDELKRAPRQTMTLNFNQFFEGFESLVPVEGSVSVIHGRTFLEVEGEVKTIVTLTCHRCLQQFNHRLAADFKELIVIENPPEEWPEELEIDSDDLAERISPNGAFDPEDWIYQNLHLHVPTQQACREECAGMEVAHSHEPQLDPRWARLLTLKSQVDE